MIFLRLFFGYLLQVLPFAALSFYPFSGHLRYSKHKAAGTTAALILSLAVLFAGAGCLLKELLPGNYTLFQAVNVVFMVSLLPCLFWYLFLVRSAWAKKLFVFSFSLVSALSVTSVCNCISTFYASSSAYDGLPYRSWTLLLLFLLTAAVLPMLLFLIKRLYLPVEDGLTTKESVYLSALSLILFAILSSGLTFISYNTLYNPMTLFLFFALLAAVFMVYFIVFKMIGISHQRSSAQRETDEARHLLSLQEEQYRHILDNIESSRRMRHDLRHHTITLRGLLVSGEVEQAVKYADDYLDSIPPLEMARLCDSEVLNAVVGYYLFLAQDREIKFTLRINAPKDTGINDIDLSVLVGNLLENAIEAASQAEGKNRFICLNVISSGKMLAITVDNGFQGPVKTEAGRYLSTKVKHDGIGLQSMEHIAAKYGGGVEFSHDHGVFHSSVMLRMG